jgi:hypothetical protein
MTTRNQRRIGASRRGADHRRQRSGQPGSAQQVDSELITQIKAM